MSGKSETPVCNLAEFEVDPVRGFLPPEDPLIRLPEVFSDWEDLAAQIPKLLATTHLRAMVSDLPEFPLKQLASLREWRRAMVVLSYLGHAYVWCGDAPESTLPAVLAVPWHAAAVRLGRPPVLSYASYAIDNWRRIDPKKPIECGNIVKLNNFLAGIDEEWFVMVHVDIEAKAGPAMAALPKLLDAANAGDLERLEQELETIANALETMNLVMDRMPENCDPYVYYHRVRPYIHGWKNHPLLVDGLRYSGVGEYDGPQQFRGETGAQSAIVPCLDAVLGIEHRDDPLRLYLNEMRYYMPPAHQAFLQYLERRANVREVVKRHSAERPKLSELYNSSVKSLTKFRSAHLQYARDYIDRQTETSSANPTKVGTGGTPFVAYLQKHRDETKEHLL